MPVPLPIRNIPGRSRVSRYNTYSPLFMGLLPQIDKIVLARKEMHVPCCETSFEMVLKGIRSKENLIVVIF